MAEKHLADLVVEISARADKFEAALQRVEAQLKKTQGSVSTLTDTIQGKFDSVIGAIGKVQGALELLGTIASLGGLTAMAKQAVSTADDLGDMAAALGLSTDQLQELTYAAEQMGSSSETMTQGIAKFEKTLADAVGGSREAGDLFKQLGLDAKELASLPLPDAMEKFATAIAGVGNQAQRVDFTTQAFGKSAVSLTAVLQQGGDTLQQFRQEAHETGNVMQSELIASAGDLQNEFQKASGAITKQMQSALINLGPLLTSSAGLFASLAQRVGEATDKFFGFTSAGIKAALAEVNADIETTKKELANAAQEIPALFSAEGLKRVGKSMLGGEGGLIDIPDTALLKQKLATLEGQSASLQAKLAAIGQAATTTGQQMSTDLVAGIDHTKSAAEKAADALGKHRDALREDIAILTQQNVILEQVKEGTLSYAEGMIKIAAITDNVKVQDDALSDAHAKLSAHNKELQQSIDDARKRWDEYQQSVQKARDDISESLTTFEEQTKAYQLQAKEIQKGIDLGLTWEQVQRSIAAATIDAKEATGEYNQEQALLARQALAAKSGVEDLTDSFNKARDASRDWALSTKDLETVVTDIIQGTQSLDKIVEDLGQTLGVRLIKGILFGKGGEEKKILGNFNELLGIDAAGIFGKEGLNLGSGLIGGIISSVARGGASILSFLGVDAGSSFGSSAVDAASIAWQTTGDDIFAAGGAPLASAQGAGASLGATLGTVGGYAAAAYFAGTFALAINDELGVKRFTKMDGIFGDLLNKAAVPQQFEQKVADALGLTGSNSARLGAKIGSFITPITGTIFGALLGSLFAHTPTEGSQARRSVDRWLKEIGVSFADQIDSSNYFFKDSKALAESMFGGDFLAASKQILTTHIGPELAHQFQAVGAFVTAAQAKKLRKPLEQTATTFGKMIVANLGDDADLQGALNEIVSKANITFEGLVGSLNDAFESNAIGVDFYKDAILGTVDLFTQDLPAGINAAKIALQSFTDDGIFGLSEFQNKVGAITKQMEGTQQAVSSLITEGLSSGMSTGDLGKQFATTVLPNVLREGLVSSILSTQLPRLFDGLDLSAPIAAGSAEADILRSRVQDLYQSMMDTLAAAGLLPPAFSAAGDAAQRTAQALQAWKDAIANVGSNLAGIPSRITEQRADLEKQIAEAEKDLQERQKAEPDINLINQVDHSQLDDLKRQLAELPSSGGAIGAELASQLATGFEEGLTQMVIDAAIIQAKLEPLKAQVGQMMAAGLEDGVLTAAEQADISTLLAAGVADIKGTAEALSPVFDNIDAAAKNIAEGTATTAENFQDIVFPAETKQVLDSIPPAKDDLETVVQGTEDLGSSLDRARISAKGMVSQLDAMGLSSGDAASAVGKMGDALQEGDTSASGIADQFGAAGAEATTIASAMGDALAHASAMDISGVVSQAEAINAALAAGAAAISSASLNIDLSGLVSQAEAIGAALAAGAAAFHNALPTAPAPVSSPPQGISVVSSALSVDGTPLSAGAASGSGSGGKISTVAQKILDLITQARDLFSQNDDLAKQLDDVTKKSDDMMSSLQKYLKPHIPNGRARAAAEARQKQIQDALAELAATTAKEKQRLVDDFMGTITDFTGETDPTAAIRADYQKLVDSVTANREALVAAGKDVDGILASLASALTVKLAEAADQADDSIRTLVDDLRSGAHDLRFGLLTNEQQAGDLQSRFDAAVAASQGGDMDAARRAMDIGNQLVEVTRNAYASSPITATTVEIVARALDSLADQFGASLTTDTGAQAVSELQDINETLTNMAANARQPVTIQIVDEAGNVQMERTFHELLYRSEQGKIMIDKRGVRQ